MFCGELISKRRTALGLSLAGLGKRIQLDRAYIHKIEKGVIKQPSLELIKKIAKGLECSYLLLLPNDSPQENPQTSSLFQKETPVKLEKVINSKGNEPTKTSNISIPILKNIPSPFPKQLSNDIIITSISLPGISNNHYAYYIRSHHMSPTIKCGDLVIFARYDNLQDTLVERRIVVARDEWGEIIIARYRKKNATGYLVGDNPEYPPLVMDGNYTIAGNVVACWRNISIL